MTTASRGRPLKFETVEQLTEKIEAYFNDCLPHPEEHTSYEFYQKEVVRKVRGKDGKMVDKTVKENDYDREPYPVTKWRISEGKRPTITGLAIFLDTSRQTLLEYEGEVEGREKNSEFADTIKKAKDLIEFHWETMLEGNNVTGVIFNLKNNFKWADKTEQEITNPDGSLSPYKDLTDEQLRALANGAIQGNQS